MFRFDDLFKGKKKTRDLKDISLNEVSYVDSPANQCQFLIIKRDSGEQLNDLDELLSCEAFTDEQAEQVDLIMKQIGDIDDDTASAIGDLLLAVTSDSEVAKYCDVGHWTSLTGIELAQLPCLVKKSELNDVEDFIQKFVTKAQMEDAELEVISKALETISDLDEASLVAVYDLLKVEFSEATIKERWPSLFSQQQDTGQEPEPVKKDTSGSKWPSISARDTLGTQKQSPIKKTGLKWPSISGRI